MKLTRVMIHEVYYQEPNNYSRNLANKYQTLTTDQDQSTFMISILLSNNLTI